MKYRIFCFFLLPFCFSTVYGNIGLARLFYGGKEPVVDEFYLCLNKTGNSAMTINTLTSRLKDINGGDLNYSKAKKYTEKAIENMEVTPEYKQKLKKKMDSLFFCAQTNSPSVQSEEEGDLPGGVIIGCFEIFAGALLHIVPYCSTIGKGLILDGTRRIFDDMQENDKEERNQTKNQNKNNVPILQTLR